MDLLEIAVCEIEAEAEGSGLPRWSGAPLCLLATLFAARLPPLAAYIGLSVPLSAIVAFVVGVAVAMALPMAEEAGGATMA